MISQVRLSCALVVSAFAAVSHGAIIYTNTAQTGTRYNPGAGSTGAPRIVFDDVLVPTAAYGANRTFEITRVSVGLRRAGVLSPAQQVTFYYSQFTGATGTGITTPEIFATLQIPQSGPTTAFVTEVWGVGNGTTPLFSVPANEVLAPGFGAFALGIRLGDVSENTGWRVTNGPGTNLNAGWAYDVASGAVQGPFTFSGANPPSVTFYLTVEGNFVPAPAGVGALIAGLGLAMRRRRG